MKVSPPHPPSIKKVALYKKKSYIMGPPQNNIFVVTISLSTFCLRNKARNEIMGSD